MLNIRRAAGLSRCIRIMILLSQRKYTVVELTIKILNCQCVKDRGTCKCRKMIYRDIMTMEHANVPVIETNGRFYIEPGFMKGFL